MSRYEKGTHTDSIKGDELLKFPSIQNWLNSLDQSATSRGKKGLTMGAKRQRLGRMLEYLNDIELNPDELIQEAEKDINRAGQRLNNYFKRRKVEGISHNTACTNLSYIRGFYTHNNLVFPKKFGIPRREVSSVSHRDEKATIYDYDEDNGETIFKNGTLQHFVQNLNFRDQTITLCLLSTGADANDLLKLKVGFVKDGKGKLCEKRRFYWHGNRAKDGIEFKTFFSEEATQFLKRYVEQERANAKNDEYLFVQTVGVNEPLPAHALAINFKTAAEKMGYITKKGESSPFRPKRFRHLFRTACSKAKIDIGFTMAFMGHASSVSNSYLEKDQGTLIGEYLKVEKYLTVFGVSKGQMTEMSETITELKGDYVTMDKRIKTLEEQLKSATELVYSFEPILNTFNSIASTPEGQELIKRIREEKLKQEIKEAETEDNKLKDEVAKEHPISKRKK